MQRKRETREKMHLLLPDASPRIAHLIGKKHSIFQFPAPRLRVPLLGKKAENKLR